MGGGLSEEVRRREWGLVVVGFDRVRDRVADEARDPFLLSKLHAVIYSVRHLDPRLRRLFDAAFMIM